MPADPLALAVTQLPGWRWMPGMHDSKGRIVLRVRARDGRPVVRSALGGEPDGSDWDDDLPDLDDDATGGCLLAMLRAAWVTDPDHWLAICLDAGDDGPPATVECFGPRKARQGTPPSHVGLAPTLGRACAEALCAIGRCG